MLIPGIVRRDSQMIPPGYKMGPLGVPVLKDVKSGSRNEQMAANQLRPRNDVRYLENRGRLSVSSQIALELRC